MLNNINLVVHELTESLKKKCKEDEMIKNTNIKNLDKYVQKINNTNATEFTRSYCVGWLKSINTILFDVVKHHDKRISDLESKLKNVSK